MKTDIEYLRELEGHLMEAARRPLEPRGRAARLSMWRRLRIQLVAAGTAGFLAVAGTIGYFATRGSSAVEATAMMTAGPAEEKGLLTRGPFDNQLGYAPTLGGPAPAASSTPAVLPPTHAPRTGSPVGPSVIKTADLSIRVAKGTFGRQFGKATRVAGTYGGYVATSTVENGRSESGYMTIRVPADRFELALADLRALGHVDRASVSGQDVTAKFVDLAARLRNARDKVAVLRRLLSKAPTIAATLRVSNALSNAELDVEELQGQLRVLSNRTDLGTIQLTLFEREPRKPTPTSTGHTVGGAWHRAVKGFFGVVYSVVVGLGYLVPISVLLLVVAVLIWLGVRRVRDRVAA